MGFNDTDLVREAAEARDARQAHAEALQYEEALAHAIAELRGTFEQAWRGEAVKLPRVLGTVRYDDYSLADAIGDATCEGEDSAAVQALMAAGVPGADVVLCVGTFRAAVEDAYIEQFGRDLAEVLMAKLAAEAAYQRAAAAAEALL